MVKGKKGGSTCWAEPKGIKEGELRALKGHHGTRSQGRGWSSWNHSVGSSENDFSAGIVIRSLVCFRKVLFMGDELMMNLEGDYLSDPGKKR